MSDKKLKTYLYVQMTDESGPFPKEKKRILKILLTPEQAKAVVPQKVGSNKGKLIYEHAYPLSIQVEEIK